MASRCSSCTRLDELAELDVSAQAGSDRTTATAARDCWNKAEVVSVEEKGGGWHEVVTRFTLEAEATRSPASWATASPA